MTRNSKQAANRETENSLYRVTWILDPGYPTPTLCDVVGVGFDDSEKMTFLDLFDVYFVILVIFNQYLVKYPASNRVTGKLV